MVLPSSRTQKDLDTWDAALKAYDSEDFDAALSIFEQMFDDPKALMNLGLIHMYQGNFGLAISKFVDTVRLDRSLAVGYFQRGVCHYKLKAMDKALQDFSDAEFMMRGNDIVDYEELGLHFQLRADKILLNKGLALIEIGRKYEGMNLLLQFGTTNAKPELYSMVRSDFLVRFSSPKIASQKAFGNLVSYCL
ncbi:hypothetical protein FB446DRAFT_640033 [Lentinula raphanica]|nr:hypothetical protein FB446DRAFT_640033 [Lentinula raphanica]